MKRVFVDSNVFLRLFIKDDRTHQGRAAGLFVDAERGNILLVCGPPVLFEVAWTLRSFYRLPRDKVLDAIARIVSTPGLEIIDRLRVEEALRRAQAARQEFADAYIAASVDDTECEEIATFNREDFTKLGVPIHRF